MSSEISKRHVIRLIRRRVEILLFINDYKRLAKLELLDISKRVGFLLHLITVYLRNSIINVNREKFMWI